MRMFSASEPGLDGEVGHARELSDIRGDDGQTKAARLGGDQQIVAADRRSGSFEMGADGGIGLVHRRVETQDRKARQDRIQLTCQALRSLLGGAIAQLGGDDDAGADRVFTDLGDAFSDGALGMAHQIEFKIVVMCELEAA